MNICSIKLGSIIGVFHHNYVKGILTAIVSGSNHNIINNKIFIYVKGGVRIYYPDGLIRFISNSWEGEMHV